MSGVGCDFCLWLFLHFSIYLFAFRFTSLIHFNIDSWSICFLRRYNDKLEILHADRFMNHNRIWDRCWALVRPVWAPGGLFQTVPIKCFCCGLFSLDKLFCLYWSLYTLGSRLVIYLMSSWCLCSFPIWCLGQICQFSRVLLIWATTWQNQQSDCAPIEDSDQPGHPLDG